MGYGDGGGDTDRDPRRDHGEHGFEVADGVRWHPPFPVFRVGLFEQRSACAAGIGDAGRDEFIQTNLRGSGERVCSRQDGQELVRG